MAARSSASLKIDFPEWQPQYVAALLEVNPDHLRKRVEEAQAALFSRLHVLSRCSGQETEIQAIENALGALQVLAQETIRLPLENE